MEVEANALYPRSVPRPLRPIPRPPSDSSLAWSLLWPPWLPTPGTSPGRSPVCARLQNNLVDRNRKDSLQLLRIQNDLNSLAPGHARHAGQRRALSADRVAASVSADSRRPGRRASPRGAGRGRATALRNSASIWPTRWPSSGTRSTASSRWPRRQGETRRATQIRFSLQARQAALEHGRRAAAGAEQRERGAGRRQRIARIYDRVRAPGLSVSDRHADRDRAHQSCILIRSNRRLFAQLAALSEQRSELAQKLIATQESTLALHFARTARRVRPDPHGHRHHAAARRQAALPEGSPLRADLREVREIAQTTLDKVRTLSQALHPVMLDEIRTRRARSTGICPTGGTADGH